MTEFYNKHYIRLDGNVVIKGFSDAFETPLDTDICINFKMSATFFVDTNICV